MPELIEEVLRLLDKIGVNASFVPAIVEDESPMIRTSDCLIVFTPESVLMRWSFTTEIGYDEHTAREILSEFSPKVGDLVDGGPQ